MVTKILLWLLIFLHSVYGTGLLKRNVFCECMVMQLEPPLPAFDSVFFSPNLFFFLKKLAFLIIR